jgi:cysteine-rich repeat protein
MLGRMQGRYLLALAGASLLASMLGSGCELIAGVDRDQISASGAAGPGPGGAGGAQGGGGQGGDGGGGQGGGGMGGGPECTDAVQCGTSTTCHTLTCEMEMCGSTDAIEGASCSEMGGVVCDGYGNCVECVDDTTCSNEVCDVPSHTCVPLECRNAVLDGMETDVDCGGPDCAPCAEDGCCVVFSDCLSGFCDPNGGGGCTAVCALCADHADCQPSDWCDPATNGGYCVAKKPDGDACGGDDAECTNDHCADGFCCDTACGGACEACDQQNVEGSCTPYMAGTDPETECAPDVCGGGSSCRCQNGNVDGSETDTDCGGGVCPDCQLGDSCLQNGDCVSGICTGNVCVQPGCGDGFVNGSEQCDGNGMGIPGQTATCDDDCTLASCSDGNVNGAAGETCDDGDLQGGDGCSGACAVESGWQCSGEPSVCNTVCGNGILSGSEACDDGDLQGGDGCSATCTVESGWQCSGQPSTCSTSCGDGIIAGAEACDDGDAQSGDGCSSACIVEMGWTCLGQPSSCNTTCGDGIPAGAELCDDGNQSNADDCPDGPLGSCAPATCSDGFLHNGGSGSETDIDCGGSCPDCVNGKTCLTGADCQSGICAGLVCSAPMVVSTTPADGATNASQTSTVAVTFNGAMNQATLIAKTTLDAGPCTGSVQISTDGFFTCIPMSTALPVMSVGDTVATFTPAPGLSFGSTFALRVTTAAQSAAGAPLAGVYTSATGFTTRVAQSFCDGSVVVSQIYGGGGNMVSTYTHDFIELHNRGTTAVSVAGWSVQYSSAAGTTWQVTNLSGSIPAGGYYLVQEAAGGQGSQPLPTPDAIGGINMAANNGKIALVSTTTALSGACPMSGTILDLVGYGPTASCFEGAAPAPMLTSTQSDVRPGPSCVDTQDNGNDFVIITAYPNARNTASPAATCCDAHSRNETGAPQELDYCNVQFPLSIAAAAGSPLTIYGQVYELGVTEAAGDSGQIVAELGYGPRTVNPEWQSGYTFVPAVYNVQDMNNDEYKVDFLAPAAADYGYVFRMSLDSGSTWTYCDVAGAGSNMGLVFETTRIPLMSITP